MELFLLTLDPCSIFCLKLFFITLIILGFITLVWGRIPHIHEITENPDPQEDGNARVALLKSYSSNQRQWSTTLVAVAAASIAVLQVTEKLGRRLTAVALSIIAMQAVWTLVRIYWHGVRSQYILSAHPVGGHNPYLYRLDVGVTQMCKEISTFYSYVDGIRGIRSWLLWSATSTVVSYFFWSDPYSTAIVIHLMGGSNLQMSIIVGLFVASFVIWLWPKLPKKKQDRLK